MALNLSAWNLKDIISGWPHLSSVHQSVCCLIRWVIYLNISIILKHIWWLWFYSGYLFCFFLFFDFLVFVVTFWPYFNQKLFQMNLYQTKHLSADCIFNIIWFGLPEILVMLGVWRKSFYCLSVGWFVWIFLKL